MLDRTVSTDAGFIRGRIRRRANYRERSGAIITANFVATHQRSQERRYFTGERERERERERGGENSYVDSFATLWREKKLRLPDAHEIARFLTRARCQLHRTWRNESRAE